MINNNDGFMWNFMDNHIRSMDISPYKAPLSIQRSLLDKITPSLRQVCYCIKNHEITIYFFYDEEISSTEQELAEDAEAEIIADFPSDFTIDLILKQVKYPQKMPSCGNIVFSRYEPDVSGEG